MNNYKKLMKIFSDSLRKSKDYNIAYVYGIGYISIDGHLEKTEFKEHSCIIVDELFLLPEEMAKSLLNNWRWQWFYSNREKLYPKDYSDINELDRDIPDNLNELYVTELQGLQKKVNKIIKIKF